MWDKRCCGHEGDASSEECVPEIYTGKRTQKYNSYDKEECDSTQAEQIGTECLDVLGMLLKD